MRIESSNIFMTSDRQSEVREEESENLIIQTVLPETDVSNEKINISQKAKCLAEECSNEAVLAENSKNNIKMTLDALLAELLSGKKIKILDLSQVQSTSEGVALEQDNSLQDPDTQPQGWGLSYNYQNIYHESESVSFSSAGIIKTADNREIKFSLQLEMQREYTSYESFSLRAGDPQLTDPLVINFTGNAGELSDIKFTFDLDSDGVEEQVSALKPGSGFLVIDANSDGIVNNGKELFGPETGNGFKELSAHDIDGNNWIDENDAVYNQLFVWTMDSMGESSLKSLKDAGVGAINTGSLSAEFDQKGSENQLLGRTVRTGIYLKESGTAGTIQQLDMAV